jgi:hypothetical protein
MVEDRPHYLKFRRGCDNKEKAKAGCPGFFD